MALLAGLAIAAAVLALGADPSRAAFPGTPGPIAYSKFTGDELTGGSGGLFVHGPRVNQAPERLTDGLTTATRPSRAAAARSRSRPTATPSGCRAATPTST